MQFTPKSCADDAAAKNRSSHWNAINDVDVLTVQNRDMIHGAFSVVLICDHLHAVLGGGCILSAQMTPSLACIIGHTVRSQIRLVSFVYCGVSGMLESHPETSFVRASCMM